MKKQLLFTLLLSFFLCGNAHSQNQINNWFFGDSLMMHFNDGVITTEQLFSENLVTGCEASASISDSEGNLLFYTDGKYVWNKQNELMPNGAGLQIDGYLDFLASSITQGVIILPDPANNSAYYIFYISANSLIDEGIKYSKVDMTLESGLGDVVIAEKNISILSGTFITEKMHAVMHANGRDWWLFTHKHIYNDDDSSNTFYKFLITPLGVSGPYEENVGLKMNNFYMGQMQFSPSGNRLAFAYANMIEVYDFDRCSGELSNPVSVVVDSSYDELFEEYKYASYGVSFSLDGNKLYVSNAVLSDGDTSALYQYCLNCDIYFPLTKKLIYKCYLPFITAGQHQIGPDNRIYISFCNAYLSNDFNESNMNLSVINNPNEEGFLCDFDTSSIFLNGRRVIAGLPNFANYSLGPLTGSGCDTITAINTPVQTKNTITLYPNPAKETITITSHLANYTNTSLQIFAVTGEKLLEKKITAPSQKINIAALPQGMYTVVVKDENGWLYSEKLIIMQ